jgi:hypothetical protein
MTNAIEFPEQFEDVLEVLEANYDTVRWVACRSRTCLAITVENEDWNGGYYSRIDPIAGWNANFILGDTLLEANDQNCYIPLD